MGKTSHAENHSEPRMHDSTAMSWLRLPLAFVSLQNDRLLGISYYSIGTVEDTANDQPSLPRGTPESAYMRLQ